MLPLLIAGDLIAVWQYRHLFSLDIVRKLLPGTFVGVVLGGLLLWWFHKVGSRNDVLLRGLIKVEVAVESIGLVALHWWWVWRGRGRPARTPPPPKPTTAAPAAGGRTP